MRRDSWLSRVMRRNETNLYTTRRLRGLPYPHSQAVRVAPPLSLPRESLPDVFPVPLRCKPHLWLVEAGEQEQPYDRLQVSDEVDLMGVGEADTVPLPPEPWEASRFDLRMQARIIDFRARVERGEVQEGGGGTSEW